MDLAAERRVDFGAGRNGEECKICGQQEKLLQSVKGTCEGGMALWRLYTHSVTSFRGKEGERAQLNISCQENC